ncbi:Transposable element Tcb2 transposase [Holothuria leucospilota]|uniref:Transposable element Tcb2 transposase n=1 Tax=Holothuria leucospilota TaxID=206669 RepID=A0A9Q1BG09_HOLLE|nr:Transposable element Tcb2 transposase [Holothuria leucospilota]KAJ8034495.1 Transposable element Tcb2 transposase [Holothuria leucospilota]
MPGTLVRPEVRLKIIRAAEIRRKKPYDIWKELRRTGVKISKETVKNIILRYRSRGHIRNLKRGGRRPRMTDEHAKLIHSLMEENKERTSVDLQKELLKRTGETFSTSQIRKKKRELGWVCYNTKYGQSIRHVNKVKRLIHIRELALTKETYHNVVFTDECTVELDNHARITFRKKDEKPVIKGRPKHPYKLHVWAGISKRGATPIFIFEGIMKQEFYVDILKQALVPFGRKTFPEGFRLMQDNDPKHTSNYAKRFMEEAGITWWKTPPESPDLNPIEKLWHEMKEFLRKEHKPTKKEELVQGIVLFWKQRVTPEKCRTYIGNLRKAIPAVVESLGMATRF